MPKSHELEGMTIEQLNAMLEECDQRRLEAKHLGQAIKEVLHRKLEEEHLDHWGVDPKEYREAKRGAAEAGEPLHVHLNKARRLARKADREAQSTKAKPAAVGVATKK